jgi:hypothetical protein
LFVLGFQLVLYVVQYISWLYSNMVFRRVMFGRVISKIVLCTFPVDVKLLLSLSVANPIKLHVHCFGSALDNCIG